MTLILYLAAHFFLLQALPRIIPTHLCTLIFSLSPLVSHLSHKISGLCHHFLALFAEDYILLILWSRCLVESRNERLLLHLVVVLVCLVVSLVLILDTIHPRGLIRLLRLI